MMKITTKQYLKTVSPVLLLVFIGMSVVRVCAQPPQPLPPPPPPQYPKGYEELVKRFDEAEKHIVRLSPMEFEEVPLGIREIYTQMGCTIPQTPWSSKHNIVSGEFAAPGQTDWAALCSREEISMIVVLWGGPAHCPAIREARHDRHYLQTGVKPSVDGHDIGIIFSRYISAQPPRIPALFKMDEGLPDKRAHDAINDYFLDTGGTAIYCHEGRWIEFGTSD